MTKAAIVNGFCHLLGSTQLKWSRDDAHLEREGNIDFQADISARFVGKVTEPV